MTARDLHAGADPTAAPEQVPLFRRRTIGLVGGLGALALAIAISLAVGANPLSLATVWQALTHSEASEARAIVWGLRMPRTVIAIVVGAAFAVAGALIQAITRNPLADPGLLGVNAGAGFAVTLGVGFFGVAGVSGYLWFAFAGAAGAAALVYLIGSAGRGTASPVTLVLAGVALSAILNGISNFLALIDPDTFQSVRNWGLGSVARTSLAETATAAPFLVVGMVLALLIAVPLNSVALGDDLATSLGTNVLRVRIIGMVAITLLAGGATALTGGIAFIGLMVPHVVRWFVGPDQRWILTFSALGGAVLTLVADIVGRIVMPPAEIEAGVLAAVIGAPMLIALVRRGRASGL